MGLSPIKSTPVTTLEDRSWLKDLHGLQAGVSITLDGDSVRAVVSAGSHLPSGAVLALRASDNKAVLYAGTSEEIQTLTEGGSGLTSFTITWNGQTTASIDDDATAAQVQAALEALSNIDPGDVVVTGGPLGTGPFSVKFQGQYKDTNVAAMTTTPTGGTGSVAVATGTAGGTDLGSGGSGTAIGFLHSGETVPTDGDLHVTYLHRVDVIEANLPAALAGLAGGLDAAAKADLTHCAFF